MPVSHRFLLLSSYLASTNRKEWDSQLFAPTRGKKRKKLPQGISTEQDLQEGLPPSTSFSLERLLGIYTSIIIRGHSATSAQFGAAEYFQSRLDDWKSSAKEAMTVVETSFGNKALFSSVVTIIITIIIIVLY